MANSVDELKALANTKLGFARPNRFLVTFPTSFGGSGGILGSVLGLLNIGGGGASGRYSPATDASAGTTNTGGGGGGGVHCGTDPSGGNGGSGVVIIRYKFQ